MQWNDPLIRVPVARVRGMLKLAVKPRAIRLAAGLLIAAITLTYSQSSPAADAGSAQGRFVVVLDPAHGGSDTGARLSNKLVEKDLVLHLANSLKSRLTAQGITVISTRESDLSLSAVRRAEIANHARADACLSLHATTSGTGIHLFTSSLAQVPLIRFLPWDTAQGAYSEQSLKFSSEIDTAISKENIPILLGRTALEPMDSFTCPAVAVEAAPLVRSGDVTALSDAGYQKRILSALESAIAQWRSEGRHHP